VDPWFFFYYIQIMTQLDDFLTHLTIERGLAVNSYDAYQRDLKAYLRHLAKRQVLVLSEASYKDVKAFISSLRRRGLAPSSISRHISSVRMFHRFLISEGLAQSNPTDHIQTPKQPKRLPAVLNRKEILSLLEQPDHTTPLGLRDRAILEFMYATGLRASELLTFRRPDLLFDIRLARIFGKGSKERLVPVGQHALRMIRHYLDTVRPMMSTRGSGEILFLNARGRQLSRMGLWKILKTYVRQTCKPAYTPAFVRNPSSGKRGGPAGRPGDAGPCRYHHYPDIYTYRSGIPEGSTPEVPPTRQVIRITDCGFIQIANVGADLRVCSDCGIIRRG